MHIVHCDFETRSTVDLRKAGAYVYAADPSTELLCFAWAIDDDDVKLWTPNYGDSLIELFDLIKTGDYQMWAHNASFERLIWNYICHPRMDWPGLQDKDWWCTAAAASHMALPRTLEGAANALGLPVQKDAHGHRVMLKLTKPRKATKFNKNLYHQNKKDLEILYSYCMQDVRVERELHRRLAPLPKQERYTYLLDQRINDRGIQLDTATVKSAINLDANLQQKLTDELTELTGGLVTSASQTVKLRSILATLGVVLPNLQKDVVEAALETAEGKAARLLELRLELSKASVRKYEAMQRRASADGRVRGAHMYYGAERTGRWAGRGVQFQNIYRGTIPWQQIDAAVGAIRSEDIDVAEMLFDEVPELLASSLRFMVTASPGKDLIVSDFSSIEARGLAWMAGQNDLVEAFRLGRDVYKTMGAKIYNLGDISDDDPFWKTPRGKHIRFMGKQAILGLGYGMGEKRFVAQVAQYGVEITEDFAREVKLIYRKANDQIKQWWRQCQEAAIRAIKTGEGSFAGPVFYSMEGDFLKALLPSGRDLYYYKPQVEPGTFEYEGEVFESEDISFVGVDNKTFKFTTIYTHGATLVENNVQALSRDLLAQAMFRLEAAGYPVVAHVHDEVICEVPKEFGSVDEVERIMSEVPAWAEGCPVGAEGFRHERFHKR